MQSGSPSIDESELPGVASQRTLALVNTYLVHTTRLLNEFAASAEHRLQKTRSRWVLLTPHTQQKAAHTPTEQDGLVHVQDQPDRDEAAAPRSQGGKRSQQRVNACH